MTELKEAIKSAELKCHQRGKKLTRRRREVLTMLLQANRAVSAYELVSLCNDDSDEPMPPMSVYRILEFLQAEQFVHKLETANKYIACKHIACEHEHKKPQFLICNDCNKVQELDTASEALSSVEAAASMLNFKLLNPQLEVSGSCGLCKA